MYSEYLIKIAKYAKKHYDLENIDFENPEVKAICETGFRLGSYPYYCAFEILKLQ